MPQVQMRRLICYTTHSNVIYKFNSKMMVQVHFTFSQEKYFACAGIQTHNLPTWVFLQ